MKRLLIISILCLCYYRSADSVLNTILNPILDPVLTPVSELVKELLADTIGVTCQLFADGIEQFPINPPQIENVAFQLVTPCNRIELQVEDTANFLEDPNFDVNKKTVVFVTGWLVTPDKDYVAEMAKVYQCRGGYNFIVANTGGYIVNAYLNSAYHTTKLGEFVAVGLKNLGISPNDIHLIGHSLGAQIVGSAGRHYYTLTGEKLYRITGLDPARPCFMDPIVFPRLEQGNAAFVDIVHSHPKALGIEETIGDVDFYPEGLDVDKPGCLKSSPLCSHERAIYYYMESVIPNNEYNFAGTECYTNLQLKTKICLGSKSAMGYAIDHSLNGKYFARVNSAYPYGKNATANVNLESLDCGKCLN